MNKETHHRELGAWSKERLKSRRAKLTKSLERRAGKRRTFNVELKEGFKGPRIRVKDERSKD